MPRLLAPALVAVCLAQFAWLPSARATTPGETLIDFANIHRDPDGTEYRPFQYAWNDWDKHVNTKRGLGTVLKAATNKGQLGENNPVANFDDCAALLLEYVIGAGNKAKSVSFYLEDKDGTGHLWTIPLEGQPPGRQLGRTMELAKPDSVASPGKTPGLNPKKITVWQLRGDYSDPPVEILLIKLIRAK